LKKGLKIKLKRRKTTSAPNRRPAPHPGRLRPHILEWWGKGQKGSKSNRSGWEHPESQYEKDRGILSERKWGGRREGGGWGGGKTFDENRGMHSGGDLTRIDHHSKRKKKKGIAREKQKTRTRSDAFPQKRKSRGRKKRHL